MTRNILLFGIIGIGILFGAYYFFQKYQSAPVSETSSVILPPATDSNGNVKGLPSSPIIKKPIQKPVTVNRNIATNNYIKIGQRVFLQGVYVTPLKVMYDNRCPKDVACIQAGNVELGVLLEKDATSQNMIITSGRPILFMSQTITLVSVSPSKMSNKTIQEGDYRFLITSTK